MTLSDDTLNFLKQMEQRFEDGSFEDALKPLREQAEAGDANAAELVELSVLARELRDEYAKQRLDISLTLLGIIPVVAPMIDKLLYNPLFRKEFAETLDIAQLDAFTRGYKLCRDVQNCT